MIFYPGALPGNLRFLPQEYLTDENPLRQVVDIFTDECYINEYEVHIVLMQPLKTAHRASRETHSHIHS